MKSEDQWFFVRDGERVGPVDADTLTAKIDSGELPEDTQVFREGLTDWMPASESDLLLGISTTTTVATNKTTVALVIALLLALAIGVGTAFMQQRNHTTAQASLQEQITGLQRELSAQTQLFDKQVNQSQNQVEDGLRLKEVNDQQTADLKDLEEQFNQLFNDHKKATLAIHELQSELAEEHAKRTALEKDLNDNEENRKSADEEALKLVQKAKSQVDEMSAKVETANQQNTQLLKQLEQSEAQGKTIASQLKQAQGQLTEAQAELEAALQKISSLEERLNIPPSSPSKPAVTVNPTAPDDSFGRVARIDREFNFAVINKGSSDNVKNGDTFRVVSQSTGEFIGRIKITKTDPVASIGNLNNTEATRFKIGDLLYRE